MFRDNEGFLYPVIDSTSCINCGLCDAICPVINKGQERNPLECYAAINNDEDIRYKSSSGGIFHLLAKKTIEEGGVVFGASFDEQWHLRHTYVETIDDLQEFVGSKYLQSDVKDTYREAEHFLMQGRKVLYSGTPCQIAGLRHYLRQDYEALACIEVICHGVPSPSVFRWYMHDVLYNHHVQIKKNKKGYICDEEHLTLPPTDQCNLKHISFRNKCYGWISFGYMYIYELYRGTTREKRISVSQIFRNNPFMQGFLKNIYLRPSCYQCQAKHLRSGADITIGDYWGVNHIHPEIFDDKGTSAVLINTERGRELFSNVQATTLTTTFENILKSNSCLISSVTEPIARKRFFQKKWYTFEEAVSYSINPPLPLSTKIKFTIKRLLGQKRIDKIKIIKNQLYNNSCASHTVTQQNV